MIYLINKYIFSKPGEIQRRKAIRAYHMAASCNQYSKKKVV